MAYQDNASGYRESNSTADRALTILNLFSGQRLSVSASEVGEALGVARSTAYRYLQSLVGGAFLEEAPGGGFQLGMRVLELARLARRGYGLTEVALPTMQSLAERFNQTTLLTRRSGGSIVCVERCEAAGQYIRLSYERGTTLPINAGASALILLAWLPEDEARAILSSQRLQSFTPATMVDLDAIIERLATIRSDGYAITHGELDPDMMGLAVPIFREDGAVVAGLSFVVIERRLAAGATEELISALGKASGEIGRILRIAA